jgi:hypothetical protein
MKFEENKEEFEGKITRNLKEKYREFFTGIFDKNHVFFTTKIIPV